MSGSGEMMEQQQTSVEGTFYMGENVSNKFNSYSFKEIKKLDAEISLEMKRLAVQGLTGAARASAVSERILTLLVAAPKVAESLKEPDNYDAVEEMVNRWTGYLTYHKIFAPAALLPPAPTGMRPASAEPA